MFTLSKVKECVPQALVIFFFPQLDDLVIIFSPCEDADHNLTGIDIMGLKESRGCQPYHMRKEFLTSVFKARLVLSQPNVYHLYMRPLQHPLQLSRRPNGTWRTMYKHEGLWLTIEQVVVRGTASPLAMTFTIHAKFQANAKTPVVHYDVPITAPDDFTEQLYHMSQE